MIQEIPCENYRFLDEAGDSTFYGKGKVPMIGQNGVSKSFMVGMVKFKEPLDPIRTQIQTLQNEIMADRFYAKIPSIQKKVASGGFFFHATDDIPEVRMLFFKFIEQLNCSFEVYVGQKIVALYEKKHHGHESEFYADLLSHLLKNKLNKAGILKLVIAARGNTTKNTNLNMALAKAIERNRKGTMTTEVKFDVQNQKTEPLLNISDYFCWTVQRVFEKGETRYYDYLKDKISVIVDLYDQDNYQNFGNYYSPKHPLTEGNVYK